jgi:hypothetical protein
MPDFAASRYPSEYFQCLLYYKYRSLLGVTVSHIIIGVWVLFIIGTPGE